MFTTQSFRVRDSQKNRVTISSTDIAEDANISVNISSRVYEYSSNSIVLASAINDLSISLPPDVWKEVIERVQRRLEEREDENENEKL